MEVTRSGGLLWGGGRRGEKWTIVIEDELGSGEVREGGGTTGRIPLEVGKVGVEVFHIWALHRRAERRELERKWVR